ncbi:MAG: hypothetical protein HY690_03935 [Chloroflexi bacterium]|nr:hypothetical protein [Chloroflexota bacterium]
MSGHGGLPRESSGRRARRPSPCRARCSWPAGECARDAELLASDRQELDALLAEAAGDTELLLAELTTDEPDLAELLLDF